MYGFGGMPFGKPTSHCFSLTGKEDDPWAYGLDGIMNTYKYALNNVVLHKPTYFNPLL